MKYRPDVDGLRAIAVTLVVLFHAGLGFTGGFIGVDVFFVISGFLITGLLLKEHDAGTFSITHFWVRRIRRIIPAASVMVVAVLVASFFFLLPDDFVSTAKSAIAQQVMSSNIYFWRNIDYFAGPAELKPLLHTWSLSVEEQFYVFYPALFMLLHRLGRKTLLCVLSIIGLLSFASSLYGVQHDTSFAFFQLPTRAWELIIGGIVCFLPSPKRIPSWAIALTSFVCLAMILYTGWCYSSATPFPGAAALPPCFATAIFIYVNSVRVSAPAKAISAKPIVAVGLMSYSLYLWHWPLFAFWRGFYGEPETVPALVLLAVSSLIAYCSWRFIETPLRRPAPSWTYKTYFFAATLSTIGITTLSVGIWQMDGIPNRTPKTQALLPTVALPTIPKCNLKDATNMGFPVIGNATESPKVLFWGDSHLHCMFDAIDQTLKSNSLAAAFATHGGFPPLLDAWCLGRPSEAILTWNDAVMSYIREREISDVVLVARWTMYVEGLPNGSREVIVVDSETKPDQELDGSTMARSLARTINAIEQAGARVWILTQVPTQQGLPARRSFFAATFGSGDVKGSSFAWNQDRHHKANAIIDQMRSANTNVLDTWQFCFDESKDSKVADENGWYYHDDNHLSAYGAKQLLAPLLNQLCNKLVDPKTKTVPPGN